MSFDSDVAEHLAALLSAQHQREATVEVEVVS
jgi:hypothetical protein